MAKSGTLTSGSRQSYPDIRRYFRYLIALLSLPTSSMINTVIEIGHLAELLNDHEAYERHVLDNERPPRAFNLLAKLGAAAARIPRVAEPVREGY